MNICKYLSIYLSICILPLINPKPCTRSTKQTECCPCATTSCLKQTCAVLTSLWCLAPAEGYDPPPPTPPRTAPRKRECQRYCEIIV